MTKKKTAQKVPSKTRGIGFSMSDSHSFKGTVALTKVIKEYEMNLDRLYVQGIQHCIINKLAIHLAVATGFTPEQVMEEVAGAIDRNDLLHFMAQNSEYPEDECKYYIQYRAFANEQLNKVDVGESKSVSESTPESTPEPIAESTPEPDEGYPDW